jgi:hypothetical protein
MNSELVIFSQGLASLELRETDLAVAILWFLELRENKAEASASELAALLHELALSSKVNVTRLTNRLAKSSNVVRGQRKDTFKIKLAAKSLLDKQFTPLLKRQIPKVESHVLSSDTFLATRRYLETLVFQINGSYQFGFYDGCIVLCRRLMEILLIEAFETTDQASAIKRGNNYLALSEIISIAQSGQHIKLARGTAAILDEIKEAGDAGAHSRSYITKQEDIDDIKLKFRRAIAELMTLAEIEPTS